MLQQMPQVAQFKLPDPGSQTSTGTTDSNTGIPPVAQFTLPQGDNQSQSTTGSTGVDIAKGIVNFLFPAVKDVKDIVTGQNTKTPLQIAGDVGLSALPFIPGLGEAGLAAKGVEAGVEGARVAEGAGLLSKVAANPIVRNATIGYGAGVASNLSQGQDIGQAVSPNLNTVTGGLLGGAAPAILKGLGGLTEKLSGLAPELKSALQQEGEGDVNLAQKYIDITKKRASNITAPSAQNAVVDQLEKDATTLQSKADQAGAEVGAAKKAGASVPLGDITPVIEDFQKQVADQYGLQLSVGKDGQIAAEMVPGRVSKITSADQNRIVDAFRQLNSLAGEGVQKATDVIGALRNSVNYNQAGQTLGKKFDPIEGLLSHTASGIDSLLRKASPTLAAANDRFSHLTGLVNEVRSMAGGDLQRGELLMRRIFSGDKGKDVVSLFKDIQNETGTNLVKHAVLAKAATDLLGSANDKTLFEKAIETGAQLHGGNFLTPLINVGRGLLNRTITNPENVIKGAVKGKSAGLIPSKAQDLINKTAIEASRLPGLIGH